MSDELQAAISNVQARYSPVLLEKANVIGTGIGYAQVGGEMTTEKALVVLVEKKVPLEELAPEDVIPRYLEGVRLDVQAVGPIQAF